MRRSTGLLAAMVILAGAPWGALLLPLADPDALGGAAVERYLPPGSAVWCAGAGGERLCAAEAEALPGAQLERHWLGTDLFGRDLLSRLLAAARRSLVSALTALVFILATGAAAGLAAASGPRADAGVSFVSDLLLSMPRLFLLLLAAAIHRPDPLLTALVIASTSWMGVARLVRAEARSLMRRDFVSAARASGAEPGRVALAHLLPHLRSTLLAAAVLRMPDLLVLDAALGYLGLSAPPPAATLGGLMSGASGSLRDAWWLGVFPGLWVLATALAFAALAERLRARTEVAGPGILH
jgi:peptide/nickel transport system permease protein